MAESLKGMAIGKKPAMQSCRKKEMIMNIEVSDPLGLCQQLAGMLLSDFKFEF